MDELFFFFYHMHVSKEDCMSLPVHERKYLIQNFIRTRAREADALQKARTQKH